MTNQQMEQPPSPDGLYHDPVFHHCVDLLTAAILSMNILHELIENSVNRFVEKAHSFVQDSADWASYWSK
ncbi:MAG: hypothetical protein IGR90_06240 [Synechococcales cyanobacterium K32_A2020_035]|nr:hypothetical protein [Synechococcales cyanobacterium K32_A2020_035]